MFETILLPYVTDATDFILMIANVTVQQGPNITPPASTPATGTSDVAIKIDEWQTKIGIIVNSIVAIFAIVGGFLVFFQYMQGNDQAQKNFIKFIIGLAIMGLLNVLVKFFIPDA
jgi:hypothetical protein